MAVGAVENACNNVDLTAFADYLGNRVEYSVSCHQSVLAIVELDLGHFSVSVDEGLLVDATDPFQSSDIATHTLIVNFFLSCLAAT